MAQDTIWRLPYTAEQLGDAATNQVPRISGTTGNWECWDITTSAWVDTGVPAAGKNPYIGSDNYWYVWNSAQNQYVKTNYSVAQDAVQSVNGIFADVGGNVTLGWTNISEANPISKGGTGKTTAQSGLRALINPCSTLNNLSIASNDYIPVQDTSDQTNAKKITVESLINYISGNIPYGAKIQTGSYIGTGTVGIDNPNSITVNFVPNLIFCSKDQFRLGNYLMTTSGTYTLGVILMAQLGTSYQAGFGFGGRATGSGAYESYAKISSNGKTVTWYNTSNTPRMQNNESGTTYYWVAIG